MHRTIHLVLALVASALLLSSASPGAQEPDAGRGTDRRLAEALADLQRRGLKIIFSSEVVRPSMRVGEAPRSADPRRALDELLAEHGLIAQNGPGSTVIVVKNPRARPTRSLPPPQPAPPRRTESRQVEPPRFEETIQVIDAHLAGSSPGPPPLAPSAVEVRGLAGGFENVFRALQAMPGVTGTDELGSRIAVRGGGPDQNLTVMDGIEVHNPFRLVVPGEDLAMVGLASIFNADTIESATLFSGAFDVRHGDRLSSLLVVKNREGSDAEAVQGASLVSLADMNVILEGRLPRRASGSWLVSARQTYLGLLAERVVDARLPSFRDLYGRVSWQPRPRQRVSLVGLAGRERTRPLDAAASDSDHATRTGNHLLGVTFESSLGSRGVSRTIASLSQFTDRLEASEQSLDNSRGANTPESIANGELVQFRLSRDIAVGDLAVRQELAFTPSASHWLDVGFEAHRLDTRWAWTLSGDRSQHQANGSSVRLGTNLPATLDSSRDSYRFGGWIQDRWQLADRFTVQPGLRVERSSLTNQIAVLPRVNLTVRAGDHWRLDGSVGLHAQSPGYEKMLHADYFIDLSPAAAAGVKAERALHAVAGIQRTFGGGLTGRVDAYYKRFEDLLVGRLETADERAARLAGYDVPDALWPSVPRRAEITTAPQNGGSGRAYGVEAYLARAASSAGAPVSGWLAYSFGRARRTAYGVTGPFDYDRRHAVTVAANVRVSARLDVSATGRWATGLPRTPVGGVRLALGADDADRDADGNRDEHIPLRDALGNPVFQPDLGDVSNINTARLPHFARIDTRVTYRPRFGGERWAFYLDLVNVLNAKNITQVDTVLVFDPTSDRPGVRELAQDRGIPFFPSVGIRFWF